MTRTPLQAGIYCRISIAAVGDTTKTDDQARICRDLAERLGWDVAAVYADGNRSAWQRNRKRPGWDAMLADVGSGLISAIIVYHGDRLVRQPWDLEVLLNLADGKGVRLASPTGERNLDDSQDRTMLRVLAAFACAESDNTSRRRKMQYDRWRREGKVRPGGKGGRAFGFESDGVTHRQDEADVTRGIARAILAGEPVRAIAWRLHAEGVRSTAGNPMRPAAIRQMMIRPRQAGLMPDGEHKAAWEPVLDRETWEIVRASLTSRPAPPGAGRALKYLLSGIARCGACGNGLHAAGPKSYRCPAVGCGKVSRSMPKLDAYVTGRVIGRLANAANPQVQIGPAGGLGAELAALTARRAETEDVIASLASHPGQRIDVLARALDSFDAKIRDIRAQLDDSMQDRLITARAGISREQFGDLPLLEQRALVRACYQVTVLPAASRGIFREEYVILTPA